MSDHVLLGAMLGFAIVCTFFNGYLAFLAYRSSKQNEGLIAATYLEARKALERSR